jgi:hypothetical protein
VFRSPDSEEARLRELIHIRKSIWKQFEDKPNETHLAAKLKSIDDQIAQFNLERMRDANQIDDFKVAAVPKIECQFLLLAVFQRKGEEVE